MSLHIFNYLTREKEPFKPLERGKVGMYVCGPTVYDHAHLGHAKLYIAMDVIVRYLRFSGYDVRYVQNITDVGHILDTGEDRIIKKARLERIEPMEIAETYTRSYFEDMDALNVVRPNISPRASGHVTEQIEIVKALIEKGHAYETSEGDVYFSVASFPEYGKLSGRKVDEQTPGSRIDVHANKRHPVDFALWKHAEAEHILRWPSPWGWGYPGWHVECTAMAIKYLGQTFDIHGGGLENIFPHNECEIAQSEACSEQPFARYFALAGSLTVNGVKMSKSTGNFLTIKDALKIYSPEAIRLFILSCHYRNPVDFSREALVSAERGVERLLNTVHNLRKHIERAVPSGTVDLSYIAELDPYRDAFIEAMNDDFNTPQAIAVLFDLNREVNALLSSGELLGRGTLSAIDNLYRDLGNKVLGIIPNDLTEEFCGEIVEGLVDIILDIRKRYRENKEWDKADELRRRLSELNVVIDDRPEGAVWRVEHGQ